MFSHQNLCSRKRDRAVWIVGRRGTRKLARSRKEHSVPQRTNKSRGRSGYSGLYILYVLWPRGSDSWPVKFRQSSRWSRFRMFAKGSPLFEQGHQICPIESEFFSESGKMSVETGMCCEFPSNCHTLSTLSCMHTVEKSQFANCLRSSLGVRWPQNHIWRSGAVTRERFPFGQSKLSHPHEHWFCVELSDREFICPFCTGGFVDSQTLLVYKNSRCQTGERFTIISRATKFCIYCVHEIAGYECQIAQWREAPNTSIGSVVYTSNRTLVSMGVTKGTLKPSICQCHLWTCPNTHSLFWQQVESLSVAIFYWSNWTPVRVTRILPGYTTYHRCWQALWCASTNA